MKNVALEILMGLATGDALGVPYEFLRRERMDAFPAVTMTGYGTHNQPVGTWSDDSSLAFCLAEMLTGDYDLRNLGNRFINWYDHAYWTAHNNVFDIGIATADAIRSLRHVSDPTKAGGKSEYSNGNGSLMRILPLALYLRGKQVEERYSIVRDVSSLTHAHIRSVISCFIYLEFALQIIEGKDKHQSLEFIRQTIPAFCRDKNLCSEVELLKFHHILRLKVGNMNPAPIENESRTHISGSGYVLHTLEAALWCVMNSSSYSEAVLKAVNLGEDTDTTGCVTGGLAALIFGYESIPESWLAQVARKDDIKDLAERLKKKYDT